MTMPGSEARKVRRYGFSCNTCRRKKVKCDGRKPTCQQCMSRGLVCSYPSDEVSNLAERRQRRRESESSVIHEVSACDRTTSPNAAIIRPRETQSESRPPTLRENTFHSSTVSPVTNRDNVERQRAEEWSETGLEHGGTFLVHGPTSRFYAGQEEKDQSPRFPIRIKSKEDQIHELAANAKMQREVWQPLGLAQMQQIDQIPVEVTKKLLAIYWTWQHPLHNCVYKPYFIRDMSLGGSYFSELLLMSIFALASSRLASKSEDRSLTRGGELFMDRVRALLLIEMSAEKPKIPTIQALLVLAGRQCSHGKVSEGWLYTGMAIRMMRDVGLHLSPSRLNDFHTLDAGDLEARKRLYLSAYIWDKTISISLGRPPSLTVMPSGIDDILDFNDDSDVWKPVMIDEMGANYPTIASFATSTFKEFCRLGEIIPKIYTYIYTHSSHTTSLDILQRLESELRAWYQSIPDHLKMSTHETLTFCPPPHLWSLNVVYHTLFILIYRPFFNHPHGRKVCIEASIIINEYLNLYMQTFDFRIATFLTSYCVYTTATINVLEIKSLDGQDPSAVAARLSVALKVLEREVKQTPGIHRSVDIIKSQLRSNTIPPRPSAREVYDKPTGSLNGVASSSITLTASQVSPPIDMNVSTDQAQLDYNLDEGPSNLLDMEWNSWDIAGGFQPDSYRWTANDTFLTSHTNDPWGASSPG